MTRKTKGILVIIGLLGPWFFLLQNIDLAMAKDPEYPTKPIEFIIGYSPGGTTGLVSRAITKAASKHLDQPLIPITKAGAGGIIAATAVMTAKPDGYTIGVIPSSTAFVPPFSEGAPYKDLKGFTWIMNFGTYIWPLIIRGDAPWKNWKEFIEWAKKNPRATKIGITGAKTADYKGLILWQVEKKEKAEFTYITFKGSAEILSAILGGHINFYGSTVDVSTMSYVKEGKLRILAYSGIYKVPGYEDIPSLQELYGFRIPDLLAIHGPRGLPDYVVKKLEDAFAKAIKDPEFLELMDRMHMPVLYMDSATLVKYVEEWFSKTAKIYEEVKGKEAKEKK
jgi:tripartite-type tricarboxylate transporter receptor subunit TctC